MIRIIYIYNDWFYQNQYRSNKNPKKEEVEKNRASKLRCILQVHGTRERERYR